jgi:hypothetical protein
VLDENTSVDGTSFLEQQLEMYVVQLYASLLGYQIKSVIYYQRRCGLVFAGDLFKWDAWEGELVAAQQLQQLIRQDAAQFNTQEICGQLQDLARIAEVQNLSLENIITSIQNQTARQIEMQKTATDNQCLRELYIINPSDDKARLEEAKEGLLKDPYG